MPGKAVRAPPIFDVCVVGLGYVGLPTACAFARAGLQVVGVDEKKDIVESVNRGSSYLSEKGVAEAVKKAVRGGRLRASSDLRSAVASSRATIIAVQTPYEKGRVVLSHLERACADVARAAGKGAVIIVESTVPPGTCGRVIIPILREGGKKDGAHFFFAYCPERIAPGNSLDEFERNDRIVGADDPVSLKRAVSIMRKAVRGQLIETDILSAETSKLVENAARDVYIALANDLAKLSRSIGVDVHEVIRLANTHPRVKILNPGPGVGGPCLTKDPYLLLDGLGTEGSEVGIMIRTARSVNDGMHKEVLGLMKAGGRIPRGSKVAVLGTAYKPEVGDPRSSPSEPIIRSLTASGYDVFAYDPYCREAFGAKMARTVEEALRGARCVLILVAHGAFRRLTPKRLAAGMAPHPTIVDAAGVCGGDIQRTGAYNLVRLGDGRGASIRRRSNRR